MVANLPQVFEFGTFRLDLTERSLTRGREQIALTPKAFEVLVFLIERRGHLVEKDELMRKVWPDSFVEEGNLSRTICVLRKAMGDARNGREMIQTVPKYGYRFVSNVTESHSTANENGARHSENVPPNNLNRTLSRIVGRDEEIADIHDLLSANSSRLVTMTGVGGSGKTRLAQAVALEELGRFEDGVFFVELAGITKPELVGSSIAASLGITEIGSGPILDVLKGYLRQKRILLVVDNFEHVVSSAPQIADLLSASEAMKALVTSRVRLDLAGEIEFVVPPLAIPTDPQDLPVSDLLQFGAVKLFVERARSSIADFSLTELNARSVTEICVRLEGLPLAIELAAAWVKLLSPQAILERLEDRLKLLTRRSPDLPARQRTMRGAIEWSYDLLTPDEKWIFRCLSVFAGGFSIEAAEAVISGARPAAPEEAPDVLDAVRSLVEQSLLAAVVPPNGDIRFRMLEVVRDYAVEALTASGEGELLLRRHAEYFLAFSEEAEHQLIGAKQLQWFAKLELEHDNVRAALGWSFECDPEIGLRLAGAISYFWIVRGYYTEGLSWLKRAAEVPAASIPSVRAKACRATGQIHFRLGDEGLARHFYIEGVRFAKIGNDEKQVALLGVSLGLLFSREGDHGAAQSVIGESLETGRRLHDDHVVIKALGALGTVAHLQEDYQTGQMFLEAAATLSKQSGDRASLTHSLINLAEAHYQAGQYAPASSCVGEALVIAQELQYKLAIHACLESFASLALKQDQLERGARLAGAAEELFESLHCKLGAAESQNRSANLAKLREALDDKGIASAFQQGLRMKLEDACAFALDNPI